MIKQKVKKVVENNKLLNKLLLQPYGKYCDKKYLEKSNDFYYHINDKEYCLSGYEREGKVNMWSLLEQGHHNIGDIAIGIADQEFFDRNYPNIKKHYVYQPIYERYHRYFEKMITADDIIVLRGGGSLGNYGKHEYWRERIISQYKSNLIVSMPQTMFFSEDDNGEKAKKKAARVYKKCKKLCLMAREKRSFELMKETFKDNDVFLTPDIVMTLDIPKFSLKRNGILLCLRNDSEKALTQETADKLEAVCKTYCNEISYTDMLADGVFIPVDKRDEIVKNKLGQFAQARLIITDRIHAMVFCAISETPCIAMTSFNHKVKGSYEWLKHLDYIKFCDDVGDIEPMINELYNIGETHYDNSFTTPYFEQIINYINEHSDINQ